MKESILKKKKKKITYTKILHTKIEKCPYPMQDINMFGKTHKIDITEWSTFVWTHQQAHMKVKSKYG